MKARWLVTFLFCTFVSCSVSSHTYSLSLNNYIKERKKNLTYALKAFFNKLKNEK